MHILIPAGGRGNRLRPLTDYCPKPLLPLGDRPILSHILEAIPVELPVTVLITPDLEREFCLWRDQIAGKRELNLYVEQPQPGLTGPVAAISDWVRDRDIRDDLITFMGDSVSTFTISEFLEGASVERPRLAAYQLSQLEEAQRFGVVEIGAAGTVSSFEEKPDAPRSPWVFTGCLHLPKGLLRWLPEVAGRCPQMGHLVSALLSRGYEIDVFRAVGEWQDIGTVECFVQAHRRLNSAAERDSLAADGNQSSGVVYVHPSARVRHSFLRNCVVFSGAEITNSRLDGCVVSAGVTMLDREIENKLVMPESEVQLRGGN